MPLFVGDKIANKRDCVWQLVLVMRGVVELVCSPRATLEQVSYMNDKIEEYIELRMQCFPEKKLKPNRHYITHYPALTMQCGPLIRIWTLRFESKHSFFKKAIRSAQNFKNVTKTCAEKHQLLQAFYSAGSLFGTVVNLSHSLPFHIDLYNDNVTDAVRKFPYLCNSTETEVAETGVVHNITYEKGMFVFLKHDHEELLVGQIKLILAYRNNDVFFVVEPKQILQVFDMGLYVLAHDKSPAPFHCLPVAELRDMVPLHPYKFRFNEVLVLHHAV
jgi:hypothetical protein